ncbi:exonuclease SbcCD subunit D C-terminal domain-containing protein [Castellaniella sp.]|uniref:exonuclease SbcCD subunit D C-terminal domain-containing protein n=1 Tax=Castellaniella sp. TaxID=1955812 RepID=UPI0035683CBA
MRILHTSDWHIGRTLYGRKRHEEFGAFLGWLLDTVARLEVDVLLVAGDVFDTSTPDNRAQALYYDFLRHVADRGCRHVVVIAGNHDSPTFLEAPKALLEALDIHVVGNASTHPENEVLVLKDRQGRPELIVCAVPYLRDRDIRTAAAGESMADKEAKLLAGIREHYAAVATRAEQTRAALGVRVPIVAMGHLFTAGGQTVDGDGVRELYVGSLAHVSAAVFPASFDYVALGHLHVPQTVGGLETRRYSGSPLPMGFSEARQQKIVCLVDIAPTPTAGPIHAAADAPGDAHLAIGVHEVDIPVFQPLERIQGDWDDIARRIEALSTARTSVWLEIVYQGPDLIGDLQDRLQALLAGTHLDVLRIRNHCLTPQGLEAQQAEETLAELDPHEVFERCLRAHDIPATQWPELTLAYQDILTSIDEEDVRAE